MSPNHLATTYALLILSGLSRANVVSYTVPSPTVPHPFTGLVVQVPQFDPALGSLQSLLLVGRVHLQGNLGIENLQAVPVSGSVEVNYAATFGVVGGGLFLVGGSETTFPRPTLSSFDGTIDYAGASGTQVAFNGPASAGSNTNPTFGALDAWIGTGTVAMNTTSPSFFANIGAPQDWSLSPNFQAFSELQITYTYTNEPNEFCFGGACPCGTVGGVGGCPNSNAPSSLGGRLQPSTSSSLSNDTFTLSASGMTPTASVLFFQGTARAGAPFGDGLRCVGGTLVRLAAKTAVNGAAQYPGPGDPPISIRGQVTTPGTQVAYQALYRDVTPGFCTTASFNMTSGVRTRWQP